MQALGCIVFIGRMNNEKRFTAFTQIADGLAAYGLPLHWFESDRTIASHRAERQLDALGPLLARDKVDALRPLRQTMRRVLKGMILMAGRQRWLFIRAMFKSSAEKGAEELRSFLDTTPYVRVFLVAHSAGAIAATQLAAHPKVCGILCLGYPFKHPERPAERYRTEHLPTVTKPLLIVQGKYDEYGSDFGMLQSFLPPHCRIVSPRCDHDYLDLSDADSALVEAAIDLVMHDADMHHDRIR